MKMSLWSLSCQQSVFQRYHSEKTFMRTLPTRWRRKTAGIEIVTVTLCISMLADFLRHLVSKTLRNVLLAWYGLNTLCHQVIDHKDFFLTQLIQFYRNSAITLRPLTPHIATSYPQNGYRFVTIDLWRNFTVICIGISHYVCVSHGT